MRTIFNKRKSYPGIERHLQISGLEHNFHIPIILVKIIPLIIDNPKIGIYICISKND